MQSTSSPEQSPQLMERTLSRVKQCSDTIYLVGSSKLDECRTFLFSYQKSVDNVHKNGEGAIAEYVKTKAVRLIRSPTNLTHVEASGVVIAYLTAWDGLVTSAQIQPGQTVFINGGSSSVGRFAIQLGKLKGCKVVTSCSPGNMEGLKALGADEVYPIILNYLEFTYRRFRCLTIHLVPSTSS